jgi:DNA polymerase I-like protein with 3'-5' exonuclease and polymerase domains
MRFDAQGLFWHDVDKVKSGRDKVARVMPEIPDVPWEKLRDLPNLANASVLSIDTETNDPSIEQDLGPGWARGLGNIAGISVAADYDARWYFPIRHTIRPEDNYDPARILAWLSVELGRAHQPKVGANITYDCGWLRQEGVHVIGDLYDVQFAEALLDSDAFVSLEALAGKYLGEHKKGDVVFQWCSDYYGGAPTTYQRRNLWRAPGRLVAPYAIGDADMPIRIMDRQYPLLRMEGLAELFRMECDLIPLLIEMRFQGVPVDIDKATEVREKLALKEKELQVQLNAEAGFEVNVNAGDNLAKLFDKLGLEYPRTAPSRPFPNGKPSFKKEFLNTVQHPVAQLIRAVRKVYKTRTTFIESYILNSHVNGRIFPEIHPLKSDEYGTITGRFSMSNPNGQNLTSRDEEMTPLVRGCFIPFDGHKQWRKYDWSQLQYRFLAHYAIGDGSDELRHIFNTNPNADYHVTVQELIKRITGIELPRKPVKNINFGFVFGMGIAHLAEMLGLSLDKAEELAETYHTGVPYVKETLQTASKEAGEFGIVTTVLGRKTRFNLWGPAGYRKGGEQQPGLPYERALREYGRVKRAYTHKALNFKLQGSEGDLMKYCMLRGWKEGVFAVTGVPLLTVHDELDFSDHGQADDAFEYLQHDIMERSLKFRVPIAVGCDVGPNWAACK